LFDLVNGRVPALDRFVLKPRAKVKAGLDFPADKKANLDCRFVMMVAAVDL
jgi:hypothetical protein